MKKLWNIFFNGIINENPTLRLVIGMCAPLAVTTTVANGFWMGVAVIFVLTASNILISALRKIVPDQIRIPIFSGHCHFYHSGRFELKAIQPDIHAKLGVFVPLIVVNCIILARAEAFASKNNVLDSAVDGMGMAIGFTLALILLATIREVLGNGTGGVLECCRLDLNLLLS